MKLVMATCGVLLLPTLAQAMTAEEFVGRAAMSNQFEIESSRLAVTRAEDPQVRSMAQRIIDDHTQAGMQLQATLQQANLPATLLTPALDEEHRRMIDSLREEEDDFDQAYLDMQEDAHEDAIELYQDYVENGDNPALRQFAAQTLPTLQQHESMVEQEE